MVIGRFCWLEGMLFFDEVLLLHSLCNREIIKGFIVLCKVAGAF